MINIARQIVFNYYIENYDFDDAVCFSLDNVFVVWFSKTLHNWKALVSTTLNDGLYFEVTSNGDNQEIYLDVYNKVKNEVIKY